MADKELKYRLSLEDLFSKKMGSAADQARKMDGAMSGLGSRITQVIGGLAIAALGKSIIETTAKFQGFDNAIKTASGNAIAGATNLKFLNEQVDRLGLDITAAYSGYKTFEGALMGTALAGDKANIIFRQVSEATTVLGLSGDQTEGAFLALGQMISKGKVQAEELRGQLGERIPGAFQIAARSMNMTTAELDKFMADGKLVAEDFLPKFGAELQRTFGEKAGSAAESLQANLNRMNNEWMRLKITIGTEFLPEIISATKGIAKFLKENKELIVTGIKIVSVVGTIVLAVKAWNIASTITTGAIELMTSANAALTISLGTSLGAVGLLTAGIAALGVAIYGAISSYNELQDIRSGKGMAESGLKTEIESVNRLADRYVFLGMTREKAMQSAIQQEKKNIGLNISSLELDLKKDPENYTLQNQIKEYKGEMSALSNEKGLISQFANKLGDSSKGKSPKVKAGGGSSSSSVGSSTDVSSARPQSLIININDGLVKQMNIYAATIKESAGKIREEVSKALLETANDANLAAR